MTSEATQMPIFLEPEHDSRNDDHRQIVACTLLVAGCHPTELLETIDQALDPVALAIERPVKARRTTFVLARGDGHADAALAEVLPYHFASVTFVSYNPLGALFDPSVGSFDRALFQQLLKNGCLMELRWGEHEGYRLPTAFGSHSPHVFSHSQSCIHVHFITLGIA
jgi:hypothetical protein